MEQTVEAGTVASVVVNVIDDTGAHVAATVSTTTTRLQKGNASDTTWNSVVPTIDTIATGVYRINFTGLSPAISIDDNDDLIRVKINGSIDGGSAWTEYHLPLKVISSFDAAADTVSADVTQINGSANAAARLALSAAQIIPGTVDSTVLPTTTIFESDDITEATADHYNGRVVVWTSGNLAGQVVSVTDYELSGGRGKFTVSAMTEAPDDNDTFILV